MPNRLLVIAPTPMEFAAVQRGLKNHPARDQLELASCGVGVRQARLYCQKINPNQLSGLVLLGWAGGLSPYLNVGDVVCANSALMDGKLPVECKFLNLPGVQSGPILTSLTALMTPEAKRASAVSTALAVEMEAYPMAEWAAQHGVPFYHLRVIMDSLEESLPDFGQGLDESGRVRLFPFLKRLVIQPSLVRDLVALNGRVQSLNPILEKMAVDSVKLVLASSSYGG